MDFELLSDIERVETIAIGNALYEVDRLRKVYGKARWRKLKGYAQVKLPDGAIMLAELHWYEAHGIGRKEIKIKRLVRE
jgi:hypothetical protein